MSKVIAVWMALPIILAAQQETQDDSKQRSMAEVAMLQNLSGDWSLDVVLVGGKKYEGKVSIAGARITDHKMTFLDTENQEKKHPFIIKRIDPDNERIDMTRKKNGQVQWYSLQIDGTKIWLVRSSKHSWKLTSSITPNAFNVCTQLSRKTD